MKKGKRATLVLLVVAYALGIAVAVTVLASKTRYDCYNRRGVTGIFWCPESAKQGALLIRKSVFWPYYAYRAVRS